MHTVVDIVAEYLIFVVLLAAAIAGLTVRGSDRWQLVVRSVVGLVLLGIIVEIANHVFYDTRPFVAHHFRPYFSHPADNGFPSDHTVAGTFVAFMLWPYRRVIAPILFVLAALVGTARVVAGVHSPIDIIGAAVIAAVAALIGHLVGKAAWARWGDAVWARWSARRDPAGASALGGTVATGTQVRDGGQPGPDQRTAADDPYRPTHSRG